MLSATIPRMQSIHTSSIEQLIEQFQTLPGVGKRSAERFAYHILKTPTNDAMNMARAIRDVKQNIRNCNCCFNITEDDLCTICNSSKRNQRQLCVVEFPKDLFSIEKSGLYNGVYHVLLGKLSPLDHIGPERLKIAELFQRLKQNEFDEIILATNPTVEGDATSLYIIKKIKELNISTHISRLARGIPAGAEIEFASKAMLSDALSKRQGIN